MSQIMCEVSDAQKAQAANPKALFPHADSLAPELEACYDRTGDIPCLNHPLIIVPFFGSGMYGWANMALKERKKVVQAAYDRKEWGRYLTFHERPYRLSALHEIRDEIECDETYWDLVGHYYRDTENSWQQFEEIVELLEQDRGSAEFMMSAQDRELFKNLPDELTIYRGFNNKDGNPRGLSWTTSKKKAAFFAYRFEQEGTIVSAKINKSDALAFFTSRNEFEILLKPITLSYLEILR